MRAATDRRASTPVAEWYAIDDWNGGFFSISDRGRVVLRDPERPNHPGVDLFELAERLAAERIGPPVLVRFRDVLGARVRRLQRAFATAAEAVGHRGAYTSIYPIKVNQQRTVVDRILSEPNARVGLEAGSKPELLAVLALAPAGGVIVCNGYKDAEYIRLALIGRRLGHRVYIVIEKPSELDVVLREAKALGIVPQLGVRVRLASIGKGKWQNTGGEKAKFGLSAAEVLQLLERLRAEGGLEWLELMHFHMGSQIANIRDVQAGMGEAAHYFAELVDAGAVLKVVDVGGGLGVDYEGSRSRSDCSMNYTVEEYALNILRPLAALCEARGLEHPEVFTESGRAMTAHHAVLITNVIDHESAPSQPLQPTDDEAPLALRGLRELAAGSNRPPSEIYHDAAFMVSECQEAFARGALSLAARAEAESLYFAIGKRLLAPSEVLPDEVRTELTEKMADKYFCNFSVFQSIPDAWAIDQIFPILPLHRLNEPATARGVLQDLTCDSDGHVDRYVERGRVVSTLPLHAWRPGDRYYLGVFLVGAYQEILGDLHNLFGDTDSVNIELTDDGYSVLDMERGDTVGELLRYVHFDPDRLRRAYRDKVYAAGLKGAEAATLLGALDQGLDHTTYLTT
ncbi:MAG: biosynthetic arginine decarboxylase [Thioalkalivibrionaceae bacterium]